MARWPCLKTATGRQLAVGRQAPISQAHQERALLFSTLPPSDHPSMSFFRKKKHSPSDSGPANTLASQSQATQQPQFPTKSQSQSRPQSSQQTQQSQPLYPWSTRTPPSGQSPSPFPRQALALSTSATAAGELFLFGGYVQSSRFTCNDLYVISTRDFSTTLLRTSGDIPSPRCGHQIVLTSTTLLIWGGDSPDQNVDDSFYLLNLGTSDLFHVNTRSS